MLLFCICAFLEIDLSLECGRHTINPSWTWEAEAGRSVDLCEFGLHRELQVSQRHIVSVCLKGKKKKVEKASKMTQVIYLLNKN